MKLSEVKLIRRSLLGSTSYLLVLLAILWVPIFKAGMMSGALSVFILNMVLVLLFGTFNSQLNSKQLPWFLVWLFFAVAVFAHTFFIPLGLTLGELLDIPNRLQEPLGVLTFQVNKLRGLGAFAFFTSMWVVAWRVSWITERQIKILLYIIFVASLFQALYGLLHFLSNEVSILGLWDKKYYLADATGTFVNRNHFSGMLAICWPLVISGLINIKPMLFNGLPSSVRFLIAITYSCVIFAALVSSHSRMGLVAALFGLCVWATVFYRSRAYFYGQYWSRWLPILVLVILSLFLVWFGVEDVLQRFTKLEGGNSRIEIWKAMFKLPSSAWFVGIGPGSFEDVFHLVQPDYFSNRFIYAHNDYLEFFLEFGVVFASLILLSLIYWFRRLFPRGGYALRAGAFGSIMAVALHSLVDFNLQIPASALCFWVAVGLLMNPNLNQRIEDVISGSSNRLSRKTRAPRQSQRQLPLTH